MLGRRLVSSRIWLPPRQVATFLGCSQCFRGLVLAHWHTKRPSSPQGSSTITAVGCLRQEEGAGLVDLRGTLATGMLGTHRRGWLGRPAGRPGGGLLSPAGTASIGRMCAVCRVLACSLTVELLVRILTTSGVFTGAYVMCIVVATLVACLGKTEPRRRDGRRTLALLLLRSIEPDTRLKRLPRDRTAADRSDQPETRRS